MMSKRLLLAPLLVILAGPGALPAVHERPWTVADTLPSQLTDREFWRLSSDLSEPNGFFRSDNLVSNEHTYEYVIPALQKAAARGGVYLGVAPDQNFTYIDAVRPRMAFIVDIRRGNLLELLLYKALIEMAPDRADFVSRLFSKARPSGLGPQSTIAEIMAAYDHVATSADLYHENVKAVEDQLVKHHGFALSADDLQQLENIYYAFFWEGPSLRYSSVPGGNLGFRGFGRRGFGGMNFPSWEDMQLQTDWNGQSRSYLASEDSYRFLRGFEQKNLLVPVVGDFAGPKALRAVGQYIRDHGATVSAFYVSNVEQYLFQDGVFDGFARNVATLPVDASSTFIRSVSVRFGYSGPYVWSDGRASALDPIRGFVRDFQQGRIRSYLDVNVRSK
jgi:hypothetical protein